jgi:hypothetical protein
MPSRQLKASLRRLMSRRGFMSSSALGFAVVGLVSCMAVPAAFGIKISKQQARYQNRPNGNQRCSRCVHFTNGRCSIVQGTISPNGWCMYFAPRA